MNLTLQQGTSSVSVLKMQQCLNQLYPEFQLIEDGIFDEKTKQAVIDFQNRTHLEADGIISSLTWDKIIMKIKTQKHPEDMMFHALPPLFKGNQGLDVYKLQQYLNQIQPDHQIEVDGYFGTETMVKVIRFQNMSGLNPDGKVDIHTWNKIIEAM